MPRGADSRPSVRDLLDARVYSLLKETWTAPLPAGTSVDEVLEHLLLPPPFSTLRVNSVDRAEITAAINTAERLFFPRAVQQHPLLPDVLVIHHDSAHSRPSSDRELRDWTDFSPRGCEAREEHIAPSSEAPFTSASLMSPPSVNAENVLVDASRQSSFSCAARLPGTPPYPESQSHGCLSTSLSSSPLPEEELSCRGTSRPSPHSSVSSNNPPTGRPLPLIVVDRRCAQAVLRGAHVFAGGVLASEPHLKVGMRVEVVTQLLQLRSCRGNNARSSPLISPDCKASQGLPFRLVTRTHGDPQLVATQASRVGDLAGLSCAFQGHDSQGKLRQDSTWTGRLNNASLLRGTYLREPLLSEVRRKALTCGTGVLRQSLRSVYQDKTGIAVEMDK